jgi:hypothetical protein
VVLQMELLLPFTLAQQFADQLVKHIEGLVRQSVCQFTHVGHQQRMAPIGRQFGEWLHFVLCATAR